METTMERTFTSYGFVSYAGHIQKPLLQKSIEDVPSEAQWLNGSDKTVHIIVDEKRGLPSIYKKGDENIPDDIVTQMAKSKSEVAVVSKDQNNAFQAYLREGDTILERDVNGKLKTIYPMPTV
jgi:hypothetical protein